MPITNRTNPLDKKRQQFVKSSKSGEVDWKAGVDGIRDEQNFSVGRVARKCSSAKLAAFFERESRNVSRRSISTQTDENKVFWSTRTISYRVRNVRRSDGRYEPASRSTIAPIVAERRPIRSRRIRCRDVAATVSYRNAKAPNCFLTNWKTELFDTVENGARRRSKRRNVSTLRLTFDLIDRGMFIIIRLRDIFEERIEKYANVNFHLTSPALTVFSSFVRYENEMANRWYTTG